MKLLQETIDKESSLPNQQAKTKTPEKQSVVYTSLQISKLNLKSLRI